jgi:outer membrane biosynthesis protein TonB
MLKPGDDIETCFGTMNWRQIIPTDMTASALAHLSLLALVFLFSDVHPFGAVTAEPIAVDIVASQDIAEQAAPEKAEVEKAPEPFTIPPPPQPSLTNSNAASAPAPTPAAKPAPPAKPQKQAALSAARAAAQPQPQPAPQQPAPPPQTAAPTPAYTQPEPDITLKYSVMLGLPPDMAPAPPSGDKNGDNFDAPASKAADVASSVVADFRRHLRTCSKLPAALKDTDDVKVKLRVMMTPQGKLAAEPILIEASASEKGPLLMQAAIKALQACQPYAMLPVDRYGEWKVLDLSFTPKEFSSS